MSKDKKKYNFKYVGKTYKTNQGYDAKVIDGGSRCGYVTVKINEDEIKEVRIWYLKKRYSNLYKPYPVILN